MTTLHVLFKFGPNPYGGCELDTTANSGRFRELSPFVLGPIWLPELHLRCETFENFWQFSKVYREYVDPDDGCPTAAWYEWRRRGFAAKRAQRYPMGKGKKPMYSWLAGERLGYIQARKQLYASVYADYVERTQSYCHLRHLYQESDVLVLRDYDAYDHVAMGRTLTDVLEDSQRKCGHAFILAMMLTGERAWLKDGKDDDQ